MDDLQSCRAELTRLREAQAATREILALISQVQDDAQPVFERIADAALRLCDATQANVATFDGNLLHLKAQAHAWKAGQGEPDTREAVRRLFPRPPGRELGLTRAVQTGRRVVIPDVRADPDFSPEVARLGSAFSVIGIPMLRDGRPIGALAVGRFTAGPFPPEQVALLESFAEHATIAIENARQFRELEARNRAAAQALEEQAAASEVLRVISRSPADLGPVLDAVAASVARLADAPDVVILKAENGRLRHAASVGPFGQTIGAELDLPIDRTSICGRAVVDRTTLHLEDLAALTDPELSAAKAIQLRYGQRSMIAAPIMDGDTPLGTIAVLRREVRPFTERKVALVQMFADQVAIAIRNARLFGQIREALEHLTATSDVLRVISGSMADATPVFEKILDTCERLFGATDLAVFVVDGQGMLNVGACRGGFANWAPATYPRPLAGSMSETAIRQGAPLHWADLQHGEGIPAYIRNAVAAGGNLSVAVAPLLWEGRGIGTIDVMRRPPRPYSEKELALLATFADQAVIAIQNARLLNETRAALEQQTATSEILRVISRSPTDVQPVFDAIASSAVALCRARSANVLIFDGQLLHLAARDSMLADTGVASKVFPRPPGRDTVAGRAVLTGRVAVIAEVADDLEYDEGARRVARASGAHSFLGVPLLREGSPIGALAIGRAEAGPVPEQQITLLQTFADQAVIALENVRLFNELREKGLQLELASRHKSQFLANMSHELRTPLNAIIGFTRIVMRHARDALEPKQYDNLGKILASAQHLLALINAVLDLSKIEAGHVEVRASEVALRPMLEQCLLTIEPLVRSEAVTVVAEMDAAPQRVVVDEEKLRQIVLNLLSNAVKFTDRGSIRLRASAADSRVTIAVADTGIGIPPDKLGVVFDEFEQVDASSTRLHGGTGLGLAIARRLARLMGGDILAQSAPGRGSTFTLALPLRYRPSAEGPR